MYDGSMTVILRACQMQFEEQWKPALLWYGTASCFSCRLVTNRLEFVCLLITNSLTVSARVAKTEEDVTAASVLTITGVIHGRSAFVCGLVSVTFRQR